jgi:SAM-dependent methyltransferase
MDLLLSIATRLYTLSGRASDGLRRRLMKLMEQRRKPWSLGYQPSRNRYLARSLRDLELLELFRQGRALPNGYGLGMDARLVEIPWALSRLPAGATRVLDAGSSLNSESVLAAPALQQQKLWILTLAPEGDCFWRRGISYLFDDLRNLPFRDHHVDVVVCISTIEHVGKDNTRYAPATPSTSVSAPQARLLAITELRRVVRPGGVVLVTFPYGKAEDHGWFEQLDATQADKLIAAFAPAELRETVFRYLPTGWVVSNREDSRDAEFFDVHAAEDGCVAVDGRAGEGAVMCLELWREGE